MKKTQLLWILPVAALVGISGCNTTPLTTTLQPMAIDFALKRARFEMNCPTATASVLSSMVIQPPPRVILANEGPERAQYTIGISGCGQRQTQVVICPRGAMAASPPTAANSGSQCSRNDSARLIRFCGFTRMIPDRGLSMSAIRRKDIDTTSGSTVSKMLSDLELCRVRCAP